MTTEVGGLDEVPADRIPGGRVGARSLPVCDVVAGPAWPLTRTRVGTDEAAGVPLALIPDRQRVVTLAAAAGRAG